jgi:hypothetical protein
MRSAAITAGLALLAMAVLAPIAVIWAIPDEQYGVAALIVLVVAALDVVAAIALIVVLEPGGKLLAQTAAALRVTYAAVFAVAGAALLEPVDEARFDAIWDAGLLVFGAHLLVAAVAAWRATHIPNWLAALVGIAGIGYVIDTTVVALAPTSDVTVAPVTFIGEVVLLVWLLARCGRQSEPT